MNTYRVDRADSLRVPCGMNSIRYIGDSWAQARAVFAQLDPGRDAWNQPNTAYGLLLSEWSDRAQDYVVKASKGF